MVEQFYAVHRDTKEIFCHRGRYCFSEKGLIQSIRNDRGLWQWSADKDTLISDPIPEWEIKKVVLK